MLRTFRDAQNRERYLFQQQDLVGAFVVNLRVEANNARDIPEHDVKVFLSWPKKRLIDTADVPHVLVPDRV